MNFPYPLYVYAPVN